MSLFHLPSKGEVSLVYLLVLVFITSTSAQSVGSPQLFTGQADSYLEARCNLIQFYFLYNRLELFHRNSFSG
jgi:hypothetical protein